MNAAPRSVVVSSLDSSVASVRLPPCSSAVRCASARPSPVPPGFVVKNGWKIRSRSSGATPAPPSSIRTRTRGVSAPSSPSVETRTTPPGGVASAAFSSRFNTAASSCAASASTRSAPDGGVADDADPPLLELRPRDVEGTLDDLMQRDDGALHRPVAAESKHAVHHPIQSLHLAQRYLERTHERRRHLVLPRAALQRLQVQLDRRQRVADLVRDLVRELAHRRHLPPPLDLRHHVADASRHQTEGAREPARLRRRPAPAAAARSCHVPSRRPRRSGCAATRWRATARGETRPPR